MIIVMKDCWSIWHSLEQSAHLKGDFNLFHIFDRCLFLILVERMDYSVRMFIFKMQVLLF